MAKAMGPQQLNAMVKHSHMAELVIEEVNRRLSEGCFSNHTTEGPRGLNYLEMIIPEEYTKEARDLIAGSFIGAGWANCDTKNSSENGERPGLMSIRLYYDKTKYSFREGVLKRC